MTLNNQIACRWFVQALNNKNSLLFSPKTQGHQLSVGISIPGIDKG